jgi:predicted transcriptional regulator
MRRIPSRRKKKKAPPPPLHELEAEVMEEIWRQGESPVRSVMDALNKGSRKPRAYTTYMTIMSRLDGKGMLTRRREGKTDFYTPAFERQEYLNLRAEAEVDAVVTQYGDVALAHFARQVDLDPKRLQELKRLAEQT